MVECAVTCISIITGVNLVCRNYGIITITSEIFLLTATLTVKNNPLFDALSVNLSNSQETFVEGQ